MPDAKTEEVQTEAIAPDDCIPHEVSEAIWAFENAVGAHAPDMQEVWCDPKRTEALRQLRVAIAAAIKRGEWRPVPGGSGA